MILIPFKKVVPEEERDPNLVSYLVDNELAGIFNWAMEGYARLVKNGRFTDSVVMRVEREEYRDETIPVRRFLKEIIVLDEGSKVTNKELYPLYTKWSKMEGHHRQNAVTFGRDTKAYFRSIDIEQKKFTGGVRGYLGVSINPEMQDEILSFDVSSY